MNTVRDFPDKITSGGTPARAMGGAGIVWRRMTMTAARGCLKFAFVVLAPARLAGAVWRHSPHH